MSSDDDLKRLTVQQYNATRASEFVGLLPAYATADRPQPVAAGSTIWNTDLGLAEHWTGSAWLTGADHNATRRIHKPTITAELSSGSPGQVPDPIVFGSTIGLEFGGASDAAYRIFKISAAYVSDATAHVHWTKSADGDESGNTVDWRIQYTVFDGLSQDIGLVTPSEVTISDTYVDASTDATRIVYRTDLAPLSGFVPDYYVGIRIDTPSNTLASNPVLISVDVGEVELINRAP